VTLSCGQAFRWEKHGEWWYGVVNLKAFKIRQVSNQLEFENASLSFVKHYFGLNDDLLKIHSQICKDRHIEKAIETFNGLRILHQDPWECLISYICATYKNIKAIKQMLLNLSRRFGEKNCLDGHALHTFPTPEKLAKAKISDLTGCGLGYRAKYVCETAKMVHESKFEVRSLRELSYQKSRKELLLFPGVGLKVADCVLLFSLEKLEAFPVDLWIRRAILSNYSNSFPPEFVQKISDQTSLTQSQYEKLNSFGRKYFGEHAGYAQEYLYHYERTMG
jgi:N-glycosylase/DNA lyase